MAQSPFDIFLPITVHLYDPNSLKLFMNVCHLHIRKHSVFLQQAISDWNSLPMKCYGCLMFIHLKLNLTLFVDFFLTEYCNEFVLYVLLLTIIIILL